MTRLSDLSPAARLQAEAQGATETKPRKYYNQPQQAWGIKFASKAEIQRYGELLQMQRAGLIRELSAHPVFYLEAGDRIIGRYTADARYTICETGETAVEDTKSVRTSKTAAFRRTVRHMKAQYGIDVRVHLARRT